MSRRIEFSIGGLTIGPSRKIFVGGRNCADDLRVGDWFYAIEDRQYEWTDDEYVRVPERENPPIAVRIKVEAINSYGRALDFLSPGWTGELTIIAKEMKHLTLLKLLTGEGA